MRQLSSAVEDLASRRSVNIVAFVRMTLRDGTVFRFSDSDFVYLGNPYEPFLMRPDPFVQSINHLPDDSSLGALVREFSFDLRNHVYDEWTGESLYVRLRAHGLLFARVEVGELWLDREQGTGRRVAEPDLIRELATNDNEEVFYRGEVVTVGPVDDDLIKLACRSLAPRGGVSSGYVTSQNGAVEGSRDGTGYEHNVIYGDVARVPLVPVKAGAVSALADPLSSDTEINQISVSDVAGFPAAGQVLVGGERITYGAISGTTLTGLSRDRPIPHSAGEVVAVLPSEVVFSVATVASLVSEVWLRNPLNGLLVRAAGQFSVVERDSASIPGQVFTSAVFTREQWAAILQRLAPSAEVTQQASYFSAGSTLDGAVALFDVDASVEAAAYETGVVDTVASPPTFTYDPLAATTAGERVVAGLPLNQVLSDFSVRVRVQPSTVTDIGGASVALQVFDPAGKIPTQQAVISGVTDPSFNGSVGYSVGVFQVDATGLLSDDLNGLVIRVAPSNVQTSGGSPQYVLEFLEVRLSYRYFGAGGEADRFVDAEIAAAAGAANVELYADAQGPRVDTPFLPGYAFDDGTGWAVTAESVHTDGGTFQAVSADAASGGVVLTLEDDAINWVSDPSLPAALADATTAGRECLSISRGIGAFFDFEVTRSHGVADSSGGQVIIDIYVPGASPLNRIRIAFSDSVSGDFVRYEIPLASVSLNQWQSFVFDLTGTTLIGDNDPLFFNGSSGTSLPQFDGVEINVGMTENTGPSAVFFHNLRVESMTVGTVLISKNSGLGDDLEAALDRYELDVRVRDISSAWIQARVWFSDDGTFSGVADPVMILQFDPRTLPDDEIVTLSLVGDRRNSATVASIQKIWVSLSTGGTGLGGPGTLEVHDLRKGDATNAYLAAQGDLIENPADVVRHFLTELSDIQGASLDETSWSAAESHLAAQKVSTVLSAWGESDVEALARLCFFHRFQVLQRDANSGTEYVLQCADASLVWPAATITLTEWDRIVERSQSGEAIANDRSFVYDLLRSEDRWLRALEANGRASDLEPAVTAVALQASEDDIGRRPGRVARLDVSDEASAKETAAYYTLEELAEPRIFEVSGALWFEAYALERGDLVSFRPRWLDAPIASARVIEVRKDSVTQRIDLVAVEVRT